MDKNVWMIVVPPMGAARYVGLRIADAFVEIFGTDNLKIFDTGRWQEFYKGLLCGKNIDMIPDLIGQSMVTTALDAGVSRVLVCALSPVTVFPIHLLRRQGIRCAYWFYEDYRRATYWNEIAPAYDVFFSMQRNPVEEICRRSGISYGFLPMAADISAEILVEPSVDVAFVGFPTPYRVAALEEIVDAGLSLAIAGQGWANYSGKLESSIVSKDWIEGSAAWAVLHSGRVALNLSFENPDGDRESPQISPRAYDILLGGSPLLTEETTLTDECLFGYPIKTFRSVCELPGLIRGIILEREKTELLRTEASIRVRSQDTYKNRVEGIVERLS